MPRHLPKDVEPFPGPQSAENGLCAWKGCNKAGEYPAPKDRSLMERYMFCLDHVRAYNAQWDFHRGLSGAQLEAELQGPATWDARPGNWVRSEAGWGDATSPGTVPSGPTIRLVWAPIPRSTHGDGGGIRKLSGGRPAQTQSTRAP